MNRGQPGALGRKVAAGDPGLMGRKSRRRRYRGGQCEPRCARAAGSGPESRTGIRLLDGSPETDGGMVKGISMKNANKPVAGEPRSEYTRDPISMCWFAEKIHRTAPKGFERRRPRTGSCRTIFKRGFRQRCVTNPGGNRQACQPGAAPVSSPCSAPTRICVPKIW
jgi:hypothetical protein